ncbi:hypothetical protein DFH06DRAFT_1191595 [Mycena polygramma]|nr:hypothetical protein DFH06DRAFT_1191595 [Mycena polygramma]
MSIGLLWSWIFYILALVLLVVPFLAPEPRLDTHSLTGPLLQRVKNLNAIHNAVQKALQAVKTVCSRAAHPQ